MQKKTKKKKTEKLIPSICYKTQKKIIFGYFLSKNPSASLFLQKSFESILSFHTAAFLGRKSNVFQALIFP